MKYLFLLIVLAAAGFFGFRYWQKWNAAAQIDSMPEAKIIQKEEYYLPPETAPRKGSYTALLKRYAAKNEDFCSRKENFDRISKILADGISSEKDRKFAAACAKRVKAQRALLNKLDQCEDFGLDPFVSPFIALPYLSDFTVFVDSMLVSIEHNMTGNRKTALRDLKFLLRCEKAFLANSLCAIHLFFAVGRIQRTFTVFRRLDLSPEERARIGALFPTRADYAAAAEKVASNETTSAVCFLLACRQKNERVRKGYGNSKGAEQEIKRAAGLNPARMKELWHQRQKDQIRNLRDGKPFIDSFPSSVSAEEREYLKDKCVVWSKRLEKDLREQEKYFTANGVPEPEPEAGEPAQ